MGRSSREGGTKGTRPGSQGDPPWPSRARTREPDGLLGHSMANPRLYYLGSLGTSPGRVVSAEHLDEGFKGLGCIPGLRKAEGSG